jgi:hypothetical protein
MDARLSAPGGFFKNADFDFEARIVLGAVAGGIGDVGLVLATLDLITDGDQQSWFDAWTAAAADLAARGDEALERGHPQTASWAFLAAAEYYAKALVFVDGLADQSVLLPTFRQHLDPDNEQFFPGQPRQLYDLLPGEKQILEFTQAQGANFHCQPTGRQLAHTQMFDWLADHLPPRHPLEAPAGPLAGTVSDLFLTDDRSGRASVSSV